MAKAMDVVRGVTGVIVVVVDVRLKEITVPLRAKTARIQRWEGWQRQPSTGVRVRTLNERLLKLTDWRSGSQCQN